MQNKITTTPFGHAPSGRAVELHRLENAQGMVMRVASYGGIITDLLVPDRDGSLANVTLGFDSLAPYLDSPFYFGALIGRYCNRIGNSSFMIDGQEVRLPANNGRHHLHGGPGGLHTVVWDIESCSTQRGPALKLHYRSVDGEQAYPGNLDICVTYELGHDNVLTVHYEATSDRPTPVNLTQHAYFNLAGRGDVLAHELTIHAQAYSEVDADLIPVGTPAKVADSPFDFRRPRAIGERIRQDHPQLLHGRGYDHNFILAPRADKTCVLAASLYEPVSGRMLELLTDQPGLQFYSGNFLDASCARDNWQFSPHAGLCLEPQHFPNSPNRPDFPNTILRPGQTYSSTSMYRFSTR